MRGGTLLAAAVAWLVAFVRKRRAERRRGDKHNDDP